MTAADRPRPVISDRNAGFWQGAAEGRLVLQRCDDCGHLRYPVAGFCPRCLSEAATWTAVSGRGRVVSWVVFHRAYHRAFAEDVPYNAALIRLDEGPQMFSNVVDVPRDTLTCDMPVQVAFRDIGEGVTLPVFCPASGAAAVGKAG